MSHFSDASDGVRLHHLSWSTEDGTRPWAIAVFLHGIASNASWFSETATYLGRQGVAVYGPDRRGSGRSDGPRGHVARYGRLFADLDELLGTAAARDEGTPIFLAASSWAAKLAVVYAAQRPGELSGLLLLGPGLLPSVDLSFPRKIAVVLGHVVAPTARVAIPLEPEQYTTTPKYLDFIRADRLRLLTATTRFFWETARLDRRRRRASARLDLPLLVLQGESDAMMDVAETRAWFSRLALQDKTYVGYPGAGHTLDFEPDPTRYRTDMLTWLSDRVGRRGA